MSTRLRNWFFVFLDRLDAAKERRFLRQSFSRPVVRCYQRDDLKYYDKGYSVIVPGELMAGRKPERIIYRRSPLVWEQNGQQLTLDEQERVFHFVGNYLDQKKINWAFSDEK